MALFIDSTQATRWTITTDRLIERRAQTHQRVLAELGQRRGKAVVKREPSYHLDDGHDMDNGDDYLSIDEEATIRTFHERRILQYARLTRLPDKVGLTAVVYFKRFFIDRSVIEFNPSVIAASAVYAAAKVEEVYLPADRLVYEWDVLVNGVDKRVAKDSARAPQRVPVDADRGTGAGVADSLSVAHGSAIRVSADWLLETELEFLEHLEFHLICYHAFRSLGYVHELLKAKRLYCGDEDGDESHDGGEGGGSMLKDVYKFAHHVISSVLPLTELPVTQTPAVVALTAMTLALVRCGAEPSDEDAIAALLPVVVDGTTRKASKKGGVEAALRNAVWTVREAHPDALTPASLPADHSEGIAIVDEVGRALADEAYVRAVAALETRRQRIARKDWDPSSAGFRGGRHHGDALDDADTPYAAHKRENRDVLAGDIGAGAGGGAGASSRKRPRTQQRHVLSDEDDSRETEQQQQRQRKRWKTENVDAL